MENKYVFISEEEEEQYKIEQEEEKKMSAETKRKLAKLKKDNFEKIVKFVEEKNFKSKEDFLAEYDYNNGVFKKKNILFNSANKLVVKISQNQGDKIKVAKIYQDAYNMELEDVLGLQKHYTDYYHSNIVKYDGLYTWIDDDEKEDKRIIIATMPFYEQCVKDLIYRRRANDLRATQLLIAALNTMDYLKQEHDKQSMWNIQPGNIFISDTGVFLFSDFKVTAKNTLEGVTGQEVLLQGQQCSFYYSPEYYRMLSSSQATYLSFEKQDIFALGVVLYEFLTGDYFVKTSKQTAPLKKSNFQFGKLNGMFQEILPKMVERNMNKRLTTEEVKELVQQKAIFEKDTHGEEYYELDD